MSLTNEEMDKLCVTFKNTQYCHTLPKKAWQERYLSYNPTVNLDVLMKMHTYELFYYLDVGDEKEEDFVEMTEEELEALQVASEEALKNLETYRKQNKLWGPLLEGVFSSQTYSSLNHVALSVPMSGAGKLRNVQCQKPHEERFL